ncbi:allantoin permease, partial [Streptomyces sp. SID11233]|nr:allantoin permease [Streptomyces sp. SID11233]
MPGTTTVPWEARMSTTQSRPAAAEPEPDGAPQGGAAVRETLEDYTLRFAPRSYRRWT